MTTIEITTIEPLTHQEAMRLQVDELEHTLAMLRSLDNLGWTGATDCPSWNVRKMYRRVLGACESSASMHENIH